MLADKLSSLRKARGLTQEELALELFISRSMIAKYETGKAYPTNEILQKLSDYFNISVDELVQKEELIDEHSKTLENNMSRNNKLVVAVALVGILILAVVGVLATIEIQTTEYVVDYAQVRWEPYLMCWDLIYDEPSTPNIWQRRSRVFQNEWEIFENGEHKVQFTVDGEDWFEQYKVSDGNYVVPDDARYRLKSATLYYRVTIRKNLLGIEQGRGYFLERVDFHLK